MNNEWIEVFSTWDLMPGDEVLATAYSQRLTTRVVIQERYNDDIVWAIEKTTGLRLMINDDTLFKVKVNETYMKRRGKGWLGKK